MFKKGVNPKFLVAALVQAEDAHHLVHGEAGQEGDHHVEGRLQGLVPGQGCRCKRWERKVSKRLLGEFKINISKSDVS